MADTTTNELLTTGLILFLCATRKKLLKQTIQAHVHYEAAEKRTKDTD
jgi:hypothetical protein